MKHGTILCILSMLFACERANDLVFVQWQEYDDLPVSVQQSFRNTNQFDRYALPTSNSLVINLDTLELYDYTVKTTGPWIDYSMLTKRSNGEKFKIPTEAPFPYVIYEGNLYIPKDHNVANSVESKSTSYKKYSLK
jgi:hypothetical protein